MIDRGTLKTQLQAQLEEHLERYLAHLTDDMSLEDAEVAVQRWKDGAGQQLFATTVNWLPPGGVPAPCECGGRWRAHGQRTKQVRTLHGMVVVRRAYWYCGTCQRGVAPWDERLGIVGTQTSAGVQREAAWRAARLTMAETAEDMERAYPLRLSSRQVEALVLPVGQALAATEDAQVAHLQTTSGAAQAWQPPHRWYVEIDGVFTRVRRASTALTTEEALRDGDVYREVKIGIIGRAERGRGVTHLAAGVRLDTVVTHQAVARRTTAAAFGPLVYATLVAAGWRDHDEVIVVSDGAHWIWELVGEYLPDATQIVDLFHAREHLWTAARACYGAASVATTTWVTAVSRLLESGHVEAVITALQALVPASGDASLPEREAAYFAFHAQRMQYAAFRARGLLIGSGLAEAGCKSIVSTRCKRSGMRWTPAGIDAILPLRTAVLNRSYDAWWHSCHQRLIS